MSPNLTISNQLWRNIGLGTLGFFCFLKLYMKITAGVCKSKASLYGKTVIVTGASAGIGAFTAKELAKRGARVIMICRDVVKGESVRKSIFRETNNDQVYVMYADFASLNSVRKVAKDILSRERYIHILVNNAGAMSGAGKKSEDDLDILMQVNHFAPFLLTNLLLDRIKESAPGRIIMVSSDLHHLAKLDLECLDMSKTSNLTVAYANSKLCQILVANHLAQQLKGTGVVVNSLTPGVVHTEILRDVSPWIKYSWNTVTALFLKNVEEGAQTTLHVCLADELANVSGVYFKDCVITKISKEAENQKLGELCWELSEKAVKLNTTEG